MLEDYLKRLRESAVGDVKFENKTLLDNAINVFAENYSKYPIIQTELFPVFEESFTYVRFPMRMTNYFNEKFESLSYDDPRNYFVNLISTNLNECYKNMNHNMIRVVEITSNPGPRKFQPEGLDLRIAEKKFSRQDFEYVERSSAIRSMLISDAHFSEIFIEAGEKVRDKYLGLYNSYADRKALEKERSEEEKMIEQEEEKNAQEI